MSSTLLKCNVILIVLCIGITLIHNSSGGGKVDVALLYCRLQVGHGTMDGIKFEFNDIISLYKKNDSEWRRKDINLYFDPMDPPCRSVLLILEALNLEINLINMRLPTNIKHIQNFLKKNYINSKPPIIPIIQDGDFVLSEGHAIIVYLVRKYGGEDDNPLYPNDPKIQAQVNQRLYFDSGTLYPAFKNQYNPYIYHRIEKTKEREDKIHEALEFLENVLKKSTWTAGDSMTVADFSLVATISTFQVAGVNLKKYDFINGWLIKCTKEMVGYENANQEGITIIKSLLNYLEKFDNLNQPHRENIYRSDKS